MYLLLEPESIHANLHHFLMVFQLAFDGLDLRLPLHLEDDQSVLQLPEVALIAERFLLELPVRDREIELAL